MSTVPLEVDILFLPSKKVSWPGMKNAPAQHAASRINFGNQNLIFEAIKKNKQTEDNKKKVKTLLTCSNIEFAV